MWAGAASNISNLSNQDVEMDDNKSTSEVTLGVKRESSLVRRDSSRRRNEDEDMLEVGASASGSPYLTAAVAGSSQSSVTASQSMSRGKEPIKRQDMRPRNDRQNDRFQNDRGRPRLPTLKDHLDPAFEKLSEVEKRIEEQRIRPGFLHLTKNDDDKVIEIGRAHV